MAKFWTRLVYFVAQTLADFGTFKTKFDNILSQSLKEGIVTSNHLSPLKVWNIQNWPPKRCDEYANFCLGSNLSILRNQKNISLKLSFRFNITRKDTGILFMKYIHFERKWLFWFHLKLPLKNVNIVTSFEGFMVSPYSSSICPILGTSHCRLENDE